MKKVTASASIPTAEAYPGTAPRANRREPTANKTPIHQPRWWGAHQVDSPLETPVCFRWRRDSHRSSTSPGRSVSTKVTKGPKPRRRTLTSPAGTMRRVWPQRVPASGVLQIRAWRRCPRRRDWENLSLAGSCHADDPFKASHPVKTNHRARVRGVDHQPVTDVHPDVADIVGPVPEEHQITGLDG